MQSAAFGEFLDLLYAAPVDPALWVPAMERLADMVGGSSAWLSRLSVADGSGSGITARCDPAVRETYVDYYATRNPFVIKRDPHAYVRAWRPAIRFHGDFMARDDVVRTEFYNDFLRPQDVGSTMMIGLAASGSEICALNINTPHAGFTSAQVKAAARVHPHLRRAFDLSRHLAGAAAGADELAALDRTAAIFVVDAAARVRRANPRAQRLAVAGSGFRLSEGRLVAVEPTAAARLTRLIGVAGARALEDRDADDRGGTVRIPQPDGPPLTATVTPLSGALTSVLADTPLAIVCVDQSVGPAQAADRLRARYGLTSAEARLGMALLDGRNLREAATSFGVSVQTVRNQLQSLYGKTETNRQAALVLCLMRAGQPPA